MIHKPRLYRVLFLDVETVSETESYDQLSDTKQSLWLKKCAYLRKAEEDTPDALWKSRAAIYAEFGKIVCISVGAVRHGDDHDQLIVKSFVGSEAEILADFCDLLSSVYNDPRDCYLAGHNIREFDVPYICRRLMIHRMPLPQVLQIAGKKPWQVEHLVDSLDIWKFGDYKHYTSLELLAACFDIPTPKDDISGADVGTVYHTDHDVARIAHYCEKDVITTVQVLMALSGLEPILKDNIVIRPLSYEEE